MKKKLSKLLVIALIISCLPLQAAAACEHDWSEWDVINEPTCGEPGDQSRYCSECFEEEYMEIPATGDHCWDDWYVAKKATISKKGVKERDCLECYTTQQKEIPKLNPFVKFSKKTVKLKTSQSYKLKISYAKGDSAKKWKSSNKKIVTVSKSGKIKAKKAGTAKITVVMKSGKKTTCKIKVTAAKKKSAKSSSSKSGGTVYWTPGGSVYHSTSDCPTLSRSRTIYSGSKSKCPKPRGCKVCY